MGSPASYAKIEGIEVLKPGVWAGSRGPERFTEQDIDDAVENWEATRAVVYRPGVIDHIVGGGNKGVISRLYARVVDGVKRLYADVTNIPAALAAQIDGKEYAGVSVGFRRQHQMRGDTSGRVWSFVVEHLSWQGSHTPAVRGLAPIPAAVYLAEEDASFASLVTLEDDGAEPPNTVTMTTDGPPPSEAAEDTSATAQDVGADAREGTITQQEESNVEKTTETPAVTLAEHESIVAKLAEVEARATELAAAKAAAESKLWDTRIEAFKSDHAPAIWDVEGADALLGCLREDVAGVVTLSEGKTSPALDVLGTMLAQAAKAGTIEMSEQAADGTPKDADEEEFLAYAEDLKRATYADVEAAEKALGYTINDWKEGR